MILSHMRTIRSYNMSHITKKQRTMPVSPKKENSNNNFFITLGTHIYNSTTRKTITKAERDKVCCKDICIKIFIIRQQ